MEKQVASLERWSTWSDGSTSNRVKEHGSFTPIVTGARSPTVKTPYGAFRPPTPYSANRAYVVQTPAVMIGLYPKKPGKYKASNSWDGQTSTDFSYSMLPSTVVTRNGVLLHAPTSVRSFVETCALRKAQELKVELGTALAESRSNISMIAARSGQIARIALAMRKGRWTEVRRLLGLRGKHVKSSKRFADNYLEYSFGWAPLASDIYKASNAFVDGLSRPQTIRAKHSYRENIPFTRDRPKSTPPWGDYTVETIERWSRCVLWASPNSAYLSVLATLGLINPVSVAWALVPFSFVVDWVLPIGDFLDATTAAVGLDFLGGSYSTQVVGDFTVVQQSGANATPAVTGGLETAVRVELYRREVLGNFPGPLGVYVKNPFSMGKAITSTALIRQLRG